MNTHRCLTPVVMVMLFAISHTSAWTKQVNDGVIRWGGPGFDSTRSKGSTRFSAHVAHDSSLGNPILVILIDTKDTWQDLRELLLISPDGELPSRSVLRSKAQRHRTAAWRCVFLVEEIKPLPADVLIVAKNSEGKQLLSEKVYLRPIRRMIATEKASHADRLPNTMDSINSK